MTDHVQLERCYWNVRRTLETAQLCLTSPHPLWSELNELMETCTWLERVLEIANPRESEVGHR